MVVTDTVTGEVTRFVYDGDGKRVKATVNGVTTVYIGDYYEQSGNTIRKYYYAGGQRIAVRVDGALYFLHSDHLGSATLATDASGNRVGEVRYKPYGEVRYSWGVMLTDRLYTGQRWDSALGLYDYRARYYHPVLGRFISADPIVSSPGHPQALNRYAYVLNNPLQYTDPSGHCPWCIAIGVGALVGAGVTYGFQVAANISQNGLNIQAFTNVKWAAVGAGAVAGAVGVATFGMGTAVFGTGLAGTVAAGAIGGAVAGQAARATENVLSGQEVTAGLGQLQDLIRDAAAGAIVSGAFYGVGQALRGGPHTLLAQHYGTDIPPQIRTAYSGWKAEPVTFGEGTVLYRIHSGRPYGSWWMLEPPAGELQFRIDYAVRPEWNAATEMAILRVPKGKSLSGWIGRAAYQGGIYVGGKLQVYLPKVPPSWITSGPVPW